MYKKDNMYGGSKKLNCGTMYKKLVLGFILVSFSIIFSLPVVPGLTIFAHVDGIGTATIDGVIVPGEWDLAGTLDFAVNHPEGGTKAARLYVMNDDSNIYLALRFQRSAAEESVNPGTILTFAFKDPYGLPADGDDEIGFFFVQSIGSPYPDEYRFVDSFRNYPPCPSALCGSEDIDDSGTTDGEGAFSNDGTYSVIEVSHPLDSTDDLHDFSLSMGQAVGFYIYLLIGNPAIGTGETYIPGVEEYLYTITVVVEDSDGDGVLDSQDNCWYVGNPDQLDSNTNCPVPPYLTDPQCGDACEVLLCGDTINSNTELTSDLLNCPLHGLIIGADNIVLDCQDHTISGSGIGHGIRATFRQNILIKNCIIQNFFYGMLFSSITQSQLINNVANNNRYGFSLGSSNENELINNVANNNRYGFSLGSSLNNSFISNTADNNSLVGFYLGSSSDNTLTSNRAENNNDGFRLYASSSNNTLTSNTVQNNANGLYLSSSSNNTLTSNTVQNNGSGITIASSNNNLIYNNFFNNIGHNAWDNGNNSWNITKISGINIVDGLYLGGNFWHDYTGIDMDGDGFGESPPFSLPYNSNGYIINGGDFLPLVEFCGIRINSNTVLTSDVIPSCRSTGIVIEGNNIVLDCDGHKIVGINRGLSGIYIKEKTGVTIENCKVSNFHWGVFLEDSNNTIVRSNTLIDNNYGIKSYRSSNITITNNHIDYLNVRTCCWEGISGDGNENLLIVNNDLISHDYGIDIRGNNITITSNEITKNCIGISIVGRNNSITDNTVHWNGDGIVLFLIGENTIVSNNSVTNNRPGGSCQVEGDGIHVTSIHDVTIENNNVGSNNYGIRLQGGGRHTLRNNIVTENEKNGIRLENSDNNNINNNIVTDNQESAIFLFDDSDNNNISNNIACYNGGITAAFNSTLNSGYDNVCDYFQGWNDVGTTGCTYNCPSCSNEVRDFGFVPSRLGLQDETGIDCGGDCSNQDCCANNFIDLNLNELGQDCGGPCATCPACVPLIKNGKKSDKIDVVIVPNRWDYLNNQDLFIERAMEVVENSFLEQELLGHIFYKDKFNFWYFPKFGGRVEEVDCGPTFCDCEWHKPTHLDDDCPFADVAGIIHEDYCRDYRSGDFFSSVADHYDTFLHETGHALFDLADQYDDEPWGCETNYFEGDPYPNIWEEKAACEDESLNPNACDLFTTCKMHWGSTSSGCWKADPDDTIMSGCPLLQPGNIHNVCSFGPDSERQVLAILDEYRDPPADEYAKAIVFYMNINNGVVTLNEISIVYDYAPNYVLDLDYFNISLLAANNSLLRSITLWDPTFYDYHYGPSGHWDNVNFSFVLPFGENPRTVEIVEKTSGAEVLTVDLGEEVHEFCDLHPDDPDCQTLDLDNDGIKDFEDDCPLDIDNDADEDGFCEGSTYNPPALEGNDCDDNDPLTYPSAPELCDRKDNDCDGVVPADEKDDDADGMTECEGDACPSIAGKIEYQGCPVGDLNIVDRHVIDQAKSGACLDGAGSCRSPLANVEVRVFDRNSAEFQALYGKNPKGAIYEQVFEDGKGQIGTCTTDASGQCIAGEETVGDYLVIVKYVDADTGKTVHTGKPKSSDDFVDTDGDDAGDLATKDFQIIKVIKKNGDDQFSGGSKTVVTGSYLEIVYPDLAVWDDVSAGYVYPFIFTSDSDWTADVCARVPEGYEIVGVYDENGDLMSDSQCQQTFVSGETKVVAFDVVETGSPEPQLNASLTLGGPHGNVEALEVQVPGVRQTDGPDPVLLAGWNHHLYVGTSAPVEEALASVIDDVRAVYRLQADQTFDRWFPSRPDLSTIKTVRPYEPLFILMAAPAMWSQELTVAPPTVVDFLPGWNSVCYTGESEDVATAMEGAVSDVGVVYALGAGRTWERFVPNRPELSSLDRLDPFDCVLVHLMADRGVKWVFDV